MAEVIENLKDRLYYYKAYCWDVTDGDTIKIDWDLGRRTRGDEIIRFSRINAIELHDDGGEEAKKFTSDRVLFQDIIIRTELDARELTKYGGFNRFLAEIYYENEDGDWVNLNDELLENNLAVIYTKK